jgi:hypothetical protein
VAVYPAAVAKRPWRQFRELLTQELLAAKMLAAGGYAFSRKCIHSCSRRVLLENESGLHEEKHT